MSALSNSCPKCRARPGEHCTFFFLFFWFEGPKSDPFHPERAANTPKKSGWFW